MVLGLEIHSIGETVFLYTFTVAGKVPLKVILTCGPESAPTIFPLVTSQ